MAGLISIGVSKIEIGTPAADGGMSTTLASLGYTTKDTIRFNDEKGTETEFEAEETDLPLFIAKQGGKKEFTYQVANPDLDTLVKVFGGTKDDATKSWQAPISEPNIVQSLKFTPKQGFGFEFPKTSLSARWTSDIGKDKLIGIEVTFKVLQPDKAGLGPYKVTTTP